MIQRKESSDIPADAAARLHRAVLELFRSLRLTRPPGGLGISKLGVLGFLQRCGDTTAVALAAYLQVKPQSMTRLLADLEERGLIVRRPDSIDRRRIRIAITPGGVGLLLDEVVGQRKKLEDTMSTLLTPTEQDLLRLASDLMCRLARSVETGDAQGESQHG
jgi:DNA-binding MarR family transcriptional regulator